MTGCSHIAYDLGSYGAFKSAGVYSDYGVHRGGDRSNLPVYMVITVFTEVETVQVTLQIEKITDFRRW